MARMYPSRLEIDNKDIPLSEHRVFGALRDQLDDSFSVFHSAAWLGKGDRNELSDGEADFVIAHSKLGVLVLEVKGGTIRYDSKQIGRSGQGVWFSKDFYGSEHLLKRDPFEQAKRSKFALVKKIAEIPGWEHRRFAFGHAVLFPDVLVDISPLPAKVDKDMLLDGRDMGGLAERINGVFRSWRGDHTLSPLGDDGVALLVSLIAPSLEMKSLLASRIGNDQAQILTLTKQQYNVLNQLRRRRKALITGCAGSGKTALAVEKAKRLAHGEGMRVLLTCYNSRLADSLRVEFAQSPNVTVANFHTLCSMLAKEAGISTERPQSMTDGEYFDDFLPDQLFTALDKLPTRRYDALIVDEGQDFLPNWWVPLEVILVDNPIFYIFYDDNQRLFTSPEKLPLQVETDCLDINCRNTQTIHNVVKNFYINPDARFISAQGPAGEKVEVYTYKSPEAEEQLLSNAIERLIQEGKVQPRQIVVLTRYKPQRLNWLNKTIGGAVLRETPRGNKQILCCTIHSFKGLESPVVILAGLGKLENIDDEIEGAEDLETILYVGTSRAVSHLIVLLPQNTPRGVRKAFED